jgi:hypothetical protein
MAMNYRTWNTIATSFLCLGLGTLAAATGGCSTSSDDGGTGTGSSGGGSHQPPGGAPAGCQEDSSLSCTPDALGVTCPAGTSPDSSSLVCSDPTPNAAGDGYCCIVWSGTCAEDPSVGGCDYPSYGFSCAGSDTPDEADATLNCSSATIDPATGDSLYCCEDVYTGGGSSSGGDSGCSPDSTLTCDPGADPYDCAAGDNPESYDPSLRCSDPSTQPDGTDGFCCATGFGSSSCAEDPTVDGCAYPSVGFSCASSDTPDEADPTLLCSDAVIDPATGDSLYCCQ